MYPERPQSVADLVPLPQGNGPKIKAFDFQGPQQIEFLDHLGSGTHSIVFKVKIRAHQDNWDDPNALGAFYPYSEPFTCECRAFGRLQETGYEELAVKCFGYILLDDAHERTMMNQFAHLPAHKLSFTYDGYNDNDEEEYYKDPNLRDMRSVFVAAMVASRHFEQLGITDLDIAYRQIINGKLSDFSTSITVPHFASNPEWNLHLSRRCRSKIEFELFATCYKDFRDFDIMIHDWNKENKDHKDKQINLKALPEGYPPERRRLRNTSAQRRLNTHVDPRNYTRYLPYTNRQGQIVQRTLRALARKPSVWHMECSATAIRRLKESARIEAGLHWQYQNGHIVPLD
ncbi:kinetochore sim4 complex subunit FTA2 domain-containing protein [Fusarium mundagurra]|uniref:Kinetochore sim4 complex subunit FTA2 domain-containing protein n=1 Tax=Fusarium mundagurra TaxID=1567541 RepID=A0A8H6D9L9_9HYPO|nr:kinetochore sim4 complex subunit FTA2 domain-containing protein [Fusarium mundagurra]